MKKKEGKEIPLLLRRGTRNREAVSFGNNEGAEIRGHLVINGKKLK